MDRRFQIFVSSTFEDLKEERQAVLKGILELDHMPAGMELFPATDDSAWRLICDVIDASDYYALIIGGRYGSLDSEGIGFTEKEYEYATSTQKPVVALLHSNPDNLPRGKTETDPAAWSKLQAFREKVESRHTCVYWNSANELKAQLILGLTATFKRHPSQGWVRASSLASEEANRQIIELRSTIDNLTQQLRKVALSPPEGTEGLSQGEELFSIDFTVTFTKLSSQHLYNHQDPSRLIRENFKAAVAWNELFSAFAADFLEESKDVKMKSGIARYLKDRFADELRTVKPGYVPTATVISETLFQTIRVQFSALGLIECKTDTRVIRESEKDFRVCVLTAFGRQQLLRVKAIYREQNLVSGSSDMAVLSRAAGVPKKLSAESKRKQKK